MKCILEDCVLVEIAYKIVYFAVVWKDAWKGIKI